ncbi:hypothetical protein EDB87DRAFT_1580077 [Lactarius vividus]|nr:hypothetical protein EDB87DRAFT_1580077 [Lactarius vividus]
MTNNYPVPNHLLRHPVEQWTNTRGLVFIQSQSNFPTISSTVMPFGTAIAARNRWQCPICLQSFPRRQERDRHELKHIPYFIHCPLPHCAWRGNRTNLFKKHWQQEDHRSYHEYYGRTPERSQIETFDPRLILNQIINGSISLREAEDQTIFLVQVKAYQLQKPSMLMDPWGRNKRQLIGQAQARW